MSVHIPNSIKNRWWWPNKGLKMQGMSSSYLLQQVTTIFRKSLINFEIPEVVGINREWTALQNPLLFCLFFSIVF